MTDTQSQASTTLIPFSGKEWVEELIEVPGLNAGTVISTGNVVNTRVIAGSSLVSPISNSPPRHH